MPTADGTAGQVLQTDGSNALSWVNRTDITGKTDRTDFNAHVAQAMVTTATNAPALNNTYDLGNSTNKYNEVFSTYFRGTADLAVNATNLGSQPAANYRLATDSFTKAEVNALIAVLAHEIGHISGGHLYRTVNSMKRAQETVTIATIITAGLMAASKVAGLDTPAGLAKLATLGPSIAERNFYKHTRQNEKYADAAVGNVTGSNSVNVFLGLGLPWVVACIYELANGRP